MEDLERISKMTKVQIAQSLLALKETLHGIFADADKIRHEYEVIFNEVTAGHLPLYETEYTSPNVFAKTQSMADIAGFYRAFGMRIRGRSAERPDLASVELEFMHLLTLMEANALARNETEKAWICSDAQRKFLEAHIGRWLPAFAKLISELETTEFYCRVGNLLTTFLEDESQRLNVKPEQVTIRPQVARSGEGNTVCGLEA